MAQDTGGELEVHQGEPHDASFTFTQYGVRMPNGTEIWAPLHFEVGGRVVDAEDQNAPAPGQPFDTVDLRRLEEERMRESPGVFSSLFVDQVMKLAASAYLDAGDYAQGVHVIRRDIGLSLGAGRISVPATKYAGEQLS